MHPMYDDERGDDRRKGPWGAPIGAHPAQRGFGHRGHRIPGRGPGGHGGFPGRDEHGRGEHEHAGHGGRGRGFGQFPGFGPGFAPGFGFGREGRRARRGDVRLAILSLLADGPANGYTLIKAIAERTSGAWRPSPGSVYPTLQQLVDEGLIATTGDDGKSVYELTDAGRAEVESKADEIGRAWDTGSDMSDGQRALVEALRKCAGLVPMYRTSATDAQARAAAEKIDQLRKDLLQILAD